MRDQGRAAAVMLHDRGDAQRRAERVRVGVLVARDQDVARRGDGARRSRPGRRRATGAGRRSRRSCAPRRGARATCHARSCRPAALCALRLRRPARRGASSGIGSGHAWGSGRRQRLRRSAASERGEPRRPRARRAAGARGCRAPRCRRRGRGAPGCGGGGGVAPSSWRTNGIARCERPQRLVALGGLADDAHPDARGAEVRRRVDVGDRHEPDPRVLDVAGEDLADLLAQELVDAVGSLRSSDVAVRGGLAGAVRRLRTARPSAR